MNLQRIWEVGRGWGDQLVIGCLTETTTCVVAKPLVMIILLSNIFKHNNEKCLISYERVSMNEIILKV